MKNLLFFITFLLLSSCSASIEDNIKGHFVNDSKIDSTDIYYYYFHLDGHEYIKFYEVGYFEQVIHSPSCMCNKN